MVSFNGVRGIDEPADFLGVLEELRQSLPVVTPRFDDDGILSAPFGIKLVELGLGCLLADSAIDQLQVPQKLLLMPACPHI